MNFHFFFYSPGDPVLPNIKIVIHPLHYLIYSARRKTYVIGQPVLTQSHGFDELLHQYFARVYRRDFLSGEYTDYLRQLNRNGASYRR